MQRFKLILFLLFFCTGYQPADAQQLSSSDQLTKPITDLDVYALSVTTFTESFVQSDNQGDENFLKHTLGLRIFDNKVDQQLAIVFDKTRISKANKIPFKDKTFLQRTQFSSARHIVDLS